MKIITRGHKEVRPVTIKLADGSLVTGMINLIQRGETEHRISDIFVGREEPFVVVFHATLGEMIDKVLVLNKRHIIWVMPDEELGVHGQGERSEEGWLDPADQAYTG
jgi:hypothetical protein